MSFSNWIAAILVVSGGAFFVAGTIGVLRFRNVHSRLHALSKADNLGLGLISAGLIVRAESFSVGLKIFVIWTLALLASAVTCYVIAEWEMDHERTDRDL